MPSYLCLSDLAALDAFAADDDHEGDDDDDDVQPHLQSAHRRRFYLAVFEGVT